MALITRMTKMKKSNKKIKNQGHAVSMALNENEKMLEKVQQSWADCIYGFRTGVRKVIVNREPGIRMKSLLIIKEELDLFHSNYVNGDVSSLLWALQLCIKENLPLPYWCADGVLEKIAKVQEGGFSLHDLFSLENEFPTRGKKVINKKRSREQSLILYREVLRLKLREQDISKEAAIQFVRKKFLPTISQRTARNLFDKVEAEQVPLRKANKITYGGKKLGLQGK